ncbi:RND transporter [Bacillus sp. M6-12]|uniref:efflux RND transporter periplasmic adaptor subunit n=1 Tax=Bacillus sp. M6-12 TaxID=2054166 RepID=UPI000C775295|nr:HlyD family efflux transporter periplasmic adaptor subunit [Bacillus sp. M6-12]PLS17726.1 RND transporter [Bacillus sp. M6-12]
MSANQIKKSKKKIVIWTIGIVIVGLLAAALILPKGAGGFDEEKAATGNIATFYSFSGTVDAKSRQNIISKKEMHINEVTVKAGDQVKQGDVLIKTPNGDIKAEINGEVAQVYTKNNSHAYEGTQLMDIADYSNVQTNVKVDEYDLKYVKVGQKVDVMINALDKEIKGTVAAISKEAKNENGVSYFTAAIDLEKDKTVRVGMSAEAKLLKQKANEVTTLTMNSVQFDRNNKPYIFIRSEKGNPVKKYIQTGINDGTVIEIKGGINAGDIVMIPANSEKDSSGSVGGMNHGEMAGGNQ